MIGTSGILLILLMVFLIFRMNKPNKMMKSKTGKFAPRINRSTHFKLLFGFIVLLLVLTVLGEFVESGKQLVEPVSKIDADFEQQIDSLDSQIFNREEVDPSLLLEKRTHTAGEALTIHPNKRDEDYFDRPYIYIERKSGNDLTIEEFIYKPLLIVDDYDFSHAVHMTLPIWAEESMTPPEILKSDITYTTFQEATLLNQLTKTKFYNTGGYSSIYRSSVIHLKVPEDLIIINEYEEEQLIYIDEFD